MRGSCEGLCTLELELELCRCRTGVEAAKEDSEAALGEDSKDLDSLGLSLCTSGVDLWPRVVSPRCAREFDE